MVYSSFILLLFCFNEIQEKTPIESTQSVHQTPYRRLHRWYCFFYEPSLSEFLGKVFIILMP